MNYGFGSPATTATGFNKVVPSFGSYVTPGFGYGKPFAGKPFGGKPFGGKPFAGKPFTGKQFGGKPFAGKPFAGKGYGFPATQSSGYSSVTPSTTVATSPIPGVI
jgi:hypothetical protein